MNSKVRFLLCQNPSVETIQIFCLDFIEKLILKVISKSVMYQQLSQSIAYDILREIIFSCC